MIHKAIFYWILGSVRAVGWGIWPYSVKATLSQIEGFNPFKEVIILHIAPQINVFDNTDNTSLFFLPTLIHFSQECFHHKGRGYCVFHTVVQKKKKNHLNDALTKEWQASRKMQMCKIILLSSKLLPFLI